MPAPLFPLNVTFRLKSVLLEKYGQFWRQMLIIQPCVGVRVFPFDTAMSLPWSYLGAPQANPGQTLRVMVTFKQKPIYFSGYLSSLLCFLQNPPQIKMYTSLLRGHLSQQSLPVVAVNPSYIKAHDKHTHLRERTHSGGLLTGDKRGCTLLGACTSAPPCLDFTPLLW